LPQEIKTIPISLPYKLGSVNCYLIQAAGGFILVDTGCPQRRASLEQALSAAGCQPGDLKLVVLTHGDFDHTGNAAYLKQKFEARISMHPLDAAMLEQGNMFANRKKTKWLIRKLVPILFGFGRDEKCTPDVLLEDGADLSTYGLAAKVVHLPGHSKGSIGVLTSAGDLLCGDLFENVTQPGLNSIMDDLADARSSVDKLAAFNIRTVYPGHGKPFAWEQLGGL
jgi:hydroxyacylglutathione hydrolase